MSTKGSTLSLQHLLPISRPGTPRLGSRPGTPVSRPRTPLFGKYEDGDGFPGWQTTGSVITQALPLGRFSRWRFRIYLTFFLITLGLVIAHAIRLNPKIVSRIWQPSTPAPYHLQLLIHATGPSLGLCKTLLTGAILNYPTPTLINWGKNFTADEDKKLPPKIAKLGSIHEYITRGRKDQREDLMLVLDAEDLWFQLRPSVLIERYYDFLKQNNKIIKNVMGGHAMAEEHISSAVVFGARKTCTPNFADDLGCYPQPQSPLALDMYGRHTDSPSGHNEHSSYRPRFLDSGVIMAKAADIRQVMLRAQTKSNEEQRGPGGDDQSIFNTMFGQQEFQRQVMHERHLTLTEKFKRFLGRRRQSILDPHPTRQKMEHLKARTHDFGIGLDYGSRISYQTSDAIWDGRFIVHKDPKSRRVSTKEFDCKPAIKDVPEDIGSTYITSVRVRHESLLNKTWSDLPLYTNMCTGNIPVIVNHQGDHDERDEMWNHFWMQSDAKNLFRQQHRRAMLESPEDYGIDIGINSGAARLMTGEKLGWEQMCAKYEERLFGGKDKPDREPWK